MSVSFASLSFPPSPTDRCAAVYLISLVDLFVFHCLYVDLLWARGAHVGSLARKRRVPDKRRFALTRSAAHIAWKCKRQQGEPNQ